MKNTTESYAVFLFDRVFFKGIAKGSTWNELNLEEGLKLKLFIEIFV